MFSAEQAAAGVTGECCQKAVEVMISVIVTEVLNRDNTHVACMLLSLPVGTDISLVCALWLHRSCPRQKLIYDLILSSPMHVRKHAPLAIGAGEQTFNRSRLACC